MSSRSFSFPLLAQHPCNPTLHNHRLLLTLNTHLASLDGVAGHTRLLRVTDRHAIGEPPDQVRVRPVLAEVLARGVDVGPLPCPARGDIRALPIALPATRNTKARSVVRPSAL
jgi:hypothetical protein